MAAVTLLRNAAVQVSLLQPAVCCAVLFAAAALLSCCRVVVTAAAYPHQDRQLLYITNSSRTCRRVYHGPQVAAANTVPTQCVNTGRGLVLQCAQ
mgnify:CR=1 FL=1